MSGTISHGERVLVVDRDPVLRADVVNRLGASGHSVIGVATGAEGLNLLGHMTPTAVIAEWDATDAAGENFARAVRAHPLGRTVPILAMGDSDHAAEFQNLLALGRVWYIARGAEWSHLERTFQTMLARAEVGGVAL